VSLRWYQVPHHFYYCCRWATLDDEDDGYNNVYQTFVSLLAKLATSSSDDCLDHRTPEDGESRCKLSTLTSWNVVKTACWGRDAGRTTTICRCLTWRSHVHVWLSTGQTRRFVRFDCCMFGYTGGVASRGVVHRKPRPASHCRLLPLGEFYGMISVKVL